jgi:hypothetical protein
VKRWLRRIGASNIVSIAALLVSLTSLYFQFFYSSESLKASLVSFSMQHGAFDGEVAVINDGNRSGVVSRMALAQLIDTGARLDPIRSLDLPLVLKPGEMRLVKITAPFEVKYAHLAGRPLEGRERDRYARGHADARKVRLGLNIVSVSASGTWYETQQELVAVYTAPDYVLGHFAEPKVFDLLFGRRAFPSDVQYALPR